MSGCFGCLHGLVPMQAAGAFNRPISLQPFGQVPFRAVCGVAALVHSWAMDGALRLAAHPVKVLVQLQKDIEHVLRRDGAEVSRPNNAR